METVGIVIEVLGVACAVARAISQLKNQQGQIPSPPPPPSWTNHIAATPPIYNATSVAALPYENHYNTTPSLPYAIAVESPYETFDSTTICVTWSDSYLQTTIGTSNVPKKFLVEQRDGVFRARRSISFGSRGIIPKGAFCTLYTLTRWKTVAVKWADQSLQARIGTCNMPRQFLAKLRDGVYRTTSRLIVDDRGAIPKGAICKLLYA
jgi:hypothetical protein